MRLHVFPQRREIRVLPCPADFADIGPGGGHCWRSFLVPAATEQSLEHVRMLSTDRKWTTERRFDLLDALPPHNAPPTCSGRKNHPAHNGTGFHANRAASFSRRRSHRQERRRILLAIPCDRPRSGRIRVSAHTHRRALLHSLWRL